MPWRERRPVDERRELAVQALGGKRSVSALCREYGVSRKTAHKWLRIAREKGLGGLEDRSRRPHQVRGIAPDVEARIVAIRQQTGYGGLLIAELLYAEGIRVGHATVDRVIARAGLGPTVPCGRSAPRRFERERPNELWQMDFKAEYRLADGRVVPLTLLDDHSRYALSLQGQASTGLEETDATARSTFECYGRPSAMLMDHGVPWWSTTNGHGLTRFSVGLIEQDIELIYGAIRHPQTQGKVERFHRTCDRSLQYAGPFDRCAELIAALEPVRVAYNHRPHTALGRATPASRYVPSSRSYRATVPRWEYPEGGFLRRLNSAGVIDLGGSRHFVCEALAGKEVWCRAYCDRVLVTYRRMYIRDIDRITGKTTAVVAPVEPK